MAQQSSIRDVEHLVRLGVLFVVLLVAFVIVRGFLIPGDFGVYGFFRAGALDDVRAQVPRYAGQAACVECHVEVDEARDGGAHGEIGCESCHGALRAHAEDPAQLVPERPAVEPLCLACHRYSSYRPQAFPQVEPEEHSGGESCDACHAAHNPGFS